MKVIGITGGVGAGKTAILSYIEKNFNSRILLADEAAHKVKEPGEPCYCQLIELLGKEILREDGTIHRQKMAEKIFASKDLLVQVNAVIHPAVKKLILSVVEEERRIQVHDFLMIEAALLIEEGYFDIVDELWYIHAEEEIRRRRLKEARGYSDARTDAVMEKQLKEAEFREYCRVVIDNSASLEEACRQVDSILKGYLEKGK